jgi:hypothetical protein
MPLQATSGVASYDAYGSAAAGPKVYIEDVFSTYLYPGNSSTQTITNGIDLTGKGGMAWIKVRDSNYSHRLTDSSTSFSDFFASNETLAKSAWSGSPTVFQATSSGFNLNGNFNQINVNTVNYASWTFAKQPKFFDVVTYTGNGSNRTISHNLGSVPGCIIVKRTDSAFPWAVYHRAMSGTPGTSYMRLNATSADLGPNTELWNSTTPTATVFSVGINSDVNANGGTYVAYLFAHDAGGFGDSGTDNVISCGSFTTDGSGNATVTLGYEPQWVMYKPTSASGSWRIFDAMRGMAVDTSGNNSYSLVADASSAESNGLPFFPTATGFSGPAGFNFSTTYIYIAIRRGPMRKPTSGTGVYSSTANTNNIDSTTSVVMNPAASDLWINQRRDGSAAFWLPRLTGWEYLQSNSTNAEDTTYTWEQRTQTDLRPTTAWMAGNPSQVNHFLRRAPGFFDVVCYTGTGSANYSVAHNLAVIPEIVIIKERSRNISGWRVPLPFLGSTAVDLNLSDAAYNAGGGYFGNGSGYVAPTSTQMTLGSNTNVNNSGTTYVAYLFATCPGVSKVGSYTGTGATLQIDCGFAAGARFVLIKRTDSTGDWYVWDSARGIVAGNDPYLLWNTNTAEVTTTDWVDTYSLGFELSNAGGNNVNINTASYIYLSIA